MRTMAIISSRRCPSKPGVNTVTSTGASSTPSSEMTPAMPSSSAEHGAGDATRLLRPALAQQLRVHGDERRAERPFAEQILQHVGHAQAGAEHVGVKAGAEVGGDDALANESDDAAEEDSGGDQEGGRAAGALRLGGAIGADCVLSHVVGFDRCVTRQSLAKWPKT